MAESASEAEAPAVTRDAFYGGRLILSQPAKGHRSGTDAILLAAAVPRTFAGLACDVGSGVGAAGLGIALACPSARVRLIERDPLAAGLAGDNIAANAFGPRCEIVQRDVLRQRRTPVGDRADLVVTNPPFWDARRVRKSPREGRSLAHVLEVGSTLADWLAACLDMLAPTGTLILVHAPAALPEILATLERRLGGIKLLAVHPCAGAPAKRILVRGTNGSRAPFGICEPLVLHDEGRFTAEAERIHRGEAALTW